MSKIRIKFLVFMYTVAPRGAYVIGALYVAISLTPEDILLHYLEMPQIIYDEAFRWLHEFYKFIGVSEPIKGSIVPQLPSEQSAENLPDLKLENESKTKKIS